MKLTERKKPLLARRSSKRDDRNWCCFWGTRWWNSSTHKVEQGNRAYHLGRQNGFHKESQMGPRWTQDSWPSWINVYRCCIQRKRTNCFHLRCAEWTWSLCRWYQECLPSGAYFAEGLYYMWPWIWYQERWKICPYISGPLWRQIYWTWLQEPISLLHETSRFCIVPCGPWSVDVTSPTKWCLRIL